MQGQLSVSTPARWRQPASPEPTIVPMARLADRVLTGEIVLPKYQRAFVWGPHQAALHDDYDAFLRIRAETLHRRLIGLIGSAADARNVGTDDAEPLAGGDHTEPELD